MDIKDRGEILGNAVNTILSRNRGEARSEKTLVPDFIVYTLDSKFPSKALINNTVI